MNIRMNAIKTSKSVKSQCYVKLAVQKMKNIRIPSGKLTSSIGKSPFSIGNTSTQSGSIFQPAMLLVPECNQRVGPGKNFYNPWKTNLRVSPPLTPGKKI